VVDPLDRRERQARLPGAEDDRRDQHVQAIEASGRQEARDRSGAPFHQDAAQAARGERRQHRRGGDMPVRRRQRDHLDAIGERGAVRARRHHQPAHPVGGEHPRAWRKPAARVEHDPGRARAGDPAHGELRIVDQRRAHPDHHRVDQGAQPVQVVEPGRSVDVVRMPAVGGDAPIERLAELGDHHEVVDRAGAQRAEQRVPRCRQIAVRRAERRRNRMPLVGLGTLSHAAAGR